MPRARETVLVLTVAALLLAPLWGPAVTRLHDRGAAGGPAGPSGPRPVAAARLAAEGIVDVPVRFSVQNVDSSLVACNVDGRTYDIAGHLTAPAALLEDATRAVTLYQHGIAAGEWYWRLDVEGYDHAVEMARRGNASVTVDRLGYGASGRPDGLDACIGGEAAIAHQVVQQLRAGTYRLAGASAGAPAPGEAPAFSRVVLAGQSNGGQIAQIEAYSFRDVDGVVIMGWADLGLTQEANARFFTTLQTCLRGGSPARLPTDPAGYAYYDLGPQEFDSGNFHDSDQSVVARATPLQNRHPCGDMVSQMSAVLVDLRHIREIRVPVLLVYGEDDRRVQGGAAHRALFTGAPDTQLVTVPDAGHYMGLARGGHMVHEAMTSWLGLHGL